MKKEGKECTLKIENIEPYFIWQFGIKLPANLKPLKTTLNDLLSKDDLIDEKVLLESIDKLNKINEDESLLHNRYGLSCENNCLGNCRRFIRLEMEIDRLSEFPEKQTEFNFYWSMNPKITWLSNKTEKEVIGLSLYGLEKIHEDLYQIGMQSTSTKEYFKYLSTTDKRKVNIRMVLFNQYHRLQNKGNKTTLGDFFKRFNIFEEQIKDNYESMIFHMDEYGERFFKLKTIEGFEIIEESFGVNIDFNDWIEKIKTAQNTGQTR